MGGSPFQKIFPSSLPFFSLTCQSKMSFPSSELPSPLPLKTFLSKVGHPHLGPISPFQECLPQWVGWPIYCISIFLILLTFTPKFHCYMRSLRRAKSWQFRTSEETQIKGRMAAAPLSSQMHHLESEVFWPCRLQRLGGGKWPSPIYATNCEERFRSWHSFAFACLKKHS